MRKNSSSATKFQRDKVLARQSSSATKWLFTILQYIILRFIFELQRNLRGYIATFQLLRFLCRSQESRMFILKKNYFNYQISSDDKLSAKAVEDAPFFMSDKAQKKNTLVSENAVGEKNLYPAVQIINLLEFLK